MKKFITRTIRCILFSVLLYVLGVLLWGQLLPQSFRPNLQYALGATGFMKTRIAELDTIGQVDLLILGSSHAYRGFDTRIFKEKGIRAFNLGSSGQTPVQSLQLLRQYLDKLQPRQVWIEVNPITISSDGVESALDLIANGRSDGHAVSMVLQLNQVRLYNAFIYASYRKLTGLDKGFIEPIEIGNDRYAGGGYVERKLDFYAPAPLPDSVVQLNDLQLEALRLCRKEIEKRNGRLILLFAPVTNQLYSTYGNIAGFDAVMKEAGEYYNCNEKVLLADSLHFYDADHLNQRGVEVFNSYLINYFNLFSTR